MGLFIATVVLRRPGLEPHSPSLQGIQSVAYSPLGGQGFFNPNDLKDRDAITRVAKETGKTAAQVPYTRIMPLSLSNLNLIAHAQVLLKWNIQRGVVVIPKASSEAHLKENISGCFDWKLSNDHKVRF